jgi:hypothetical protein
MKHGSLINSVMSGMKSSKPEVGMGATVLHWSDRSPATVIEVRSPKCIVIQEDHAKRTDKNGQSESQTYEYSRNPEGRTWVVKQGKDGTWRGEGGKKNGNVVMLGDRVKYHDPTF